MDPLTISAVSGLRARSETLDMLANNLANAGTNGFKSDHEFYNLYVSAEAQAAETSGAATTVPVIEKNWTDFSQGMLVRTDNKLDLALDGKGFFTAQGPSGLLYTRNGSFRLSPKGELTTTDGYPLLTEDNKTIQSQSGSPLEVSPDGEVQQDGQTLGKLRLVEFSSDTQIGKFGATYFQMTDPSAKPVAATSVQVAQGKIEGSNVSSASSASRLVNVMRQFEMLQRAINLSGQMNRSAVEEVAKVVS
jgi:flagellar basal-body rod protein FlgF